MRRQRGVALVLVLWVISLLAVIAGNFAYSMRGEAQIAHNLVRIAQTQALADAGVHRALFELMKPPADLQRWQGDGVGHEFQLDGTTVYVVIADESGKIDLNAAPIELLKGLLKSVGLGEEAAANLAAQLKPPVGTPFDTVEDLQKVVGVSPELYGRLAPALTVYSGQAGVNTVVATREVLLAIPGVNPAMVEQFLQQRQDALANGQVVQPFVGAGAFSIGLSGSSAYAVRSEAKMSDHTNYVRQAVVRLALDGKRLPLVLAWGATDAEPAPQSKTMTIN